MYMYINNSNIFNIMTAESQSYPVPEVQLPTYTLLNQLVVGQVFLVVPLNSS